MKILTTYKAPLTVTMMTWPAESLAIVVYSGWTLGCGKKSKVGLLSGM